MINEHTQIFFKATRTEFDAPATLIEILDRILLSQARR